jgi:hypothetical protein|tara:strand:- start:2131 stop:2631 length:501 start_codon:yes stop_codon:yes gene_type:complete
LKSGKYPKDFYSPQSNEFYELTDIDLLQLYALLTPSEIIKEFGRRSRCEKSIGAAQSLLKVKFAPRKMVSSREETLSKWATGYRGGLPLNWSRDKNLIRRGRPNKPRPGSSRGKIGKTRVIGAKKVLKDFKSLIGTLQALIRKHGKGDAKGLQKAYKAVRTSVSVK